MNIVFDFMTLIPANQRTKSILDFLKTSFAIAHNLSLFTLASDRLFRQGQTAAIFYTKYQTNQALGHILTFCSSESSGALHPQFNSPSASMASLSLLELAIQLHLRHPMAFPIPSPQIHIPLSENVFRPITAVSHSWYQFLPYFGFPLL